MTTNHLLHAQLPLRLGVQTAKGPLIAPLWFEWDGERFWCATQNDALVVRAVRTTPQCAFDLSTNDMPYRGLRGRARVTVDATRGAAVLERLIDKYLDGRDNSLARWLLSRSEREVALAITPTWQTGWDYSARMSSARVSPTPPRENT
jgi:nitroimidazol reductase NimA-like FMN-containing flavoprotein (pyridoxamine 5'-phosphate oxidase superfamily)